MTCSTAWSTDQSGGVQHLRIRCGLERRGCAVLSRSSRSRKSRSKSSILAENPFCINCLCRRAARASTLAVKNTFSVASGKMTVPMSRPSATRPGALRKPAGAPTSACRTGRGRRSRKRGCRPLRRGCPPITSHAVELRAALRNVMCSCFDQLCQGVRVVQVDVVAHAASAVSRYSAPLSSSGSRASRRRARRPCPCRKPSGRRW